MLILVPSPLSQTDAQLPLLHSDLERVRQCAVWLVETPKVARAALKLFNMPVAIHELELYSIATTSEQELIKLLSESSKLKPIGLISDAGCPAIADPGAIAVQIAHKLKITVYPLVGPSSIILGLMGSGLNGQNFQFLGYPPVETQERKQWIQQRETISQAENSTQIAIETPYRNQKLFESFLHTLRPSTLLCVGSDLTGSHMRILTKTTQEWKSYNLQLDKTPTLFLWLATNK